jgi:CheY-like chemotaxis protein
MFRYGLRAVLEGAEEVTVMGEAADGQQLLTLVEETRPDVVLTDLAMPSLDGATATQQLLQRHPDLGVLVLTMHEDDEMLFGAPRAPAATCSKALTRPRSCGPWWGRARSVTCTHAASVTTRSFPKRKLVVAYSRRKGVRVVLPRLLVTSPPQLRHIGIGQLLSGPPTMGGIPSAHEVAGQGASTPR